MNLHKERVTTQFRLAQGSITNLGIKCQQSPKNVLVKFTEKLADTATSSGSLTLRDRIEIMKTVESDRPPRSKSKVRSDPPLQQPVRNYLKLGVTSGESDALWVCFPMLEKDRLIR